MRHVRRTVALMILAGVAGGCGQLGGGGGLGATGSHATSIAATASPPSDPGNWAPPGQARIGSIPNHFFNFSGYAFYRPPPDARPAVSQGQADADALAAPNLYASSGQTLKVRENYLVDEVYDSHPGVSILVWVVDTSPDNPFPGGTGLGPPGGTQSSAVAQPTPAMDQWSWVIVNASTGAYGAYAG